jgi:hypothetical protein
MFFGTLRCVISGRRSVAHRASMALREAVRSALIEPLEPRRHFTVTVTSFTVQNGVADVFARTHQTDVHVVDLYEGTLNSTPVAYLDGQGSSATDTITAIGDNTVLHDLTAGVNKPGGGIVFNAGGHGMLEFNAGPLDQYITVEHGDGISNPDVVVRYTPLSTSEQTVIGRDTLGYGVPNLTIITNPDVTRDIISGVRTRVNVPQLRDTHLFVDTGASTYDTINIGGNGGGGAGGDNLSVNDAVIHTGAGHNTVNVTASDGPDTDGISLATVDMGAGNAGTGTNALGLGNALNVGLGSQVTLTQTAGDPHTVVVDTVNVAPTGILKVTDAATLGQVQVDAGGKATISAPSTVDSFNVDGIAVVEKPTTINSLTTTNTTSSGTTTFTGQAGGSAAHTVDYGGTITVGSGATVTLGDTLSTTTNRSFINNLISNGTSLIKKNADITSLTGSGLTEFIGTSGSSTIGMAIVTGTVKVDTNAIVTVNDISTIHTLYVSGVANLNAVDPTTTNRTMVTSFTVNTGGVSNVNVLATIDTLDVSGVVNLNVPTATTNRTMVTSFTVTSAGVANVNVLTTISTLDCQGAAYFSLTTDMNTLNLSNNGKMVFTNTSTNSASAHQLSMIASINIATNQAGVAMGLLDVGSQDVITQTDHNKIRDYIVAGYNAAVFGGENGKWDGNGISSSTASYWYSVDAGISKYAVGYAWGGDGSVTDQQGNAQGNDNYNLDNVEPNQTLIRPCLTGDVNMDGVVDFNDIQSILAYNFNSGQAATYTQGDLAALGIVNGDDIAFVLAANYNTLEYF